VTKALRWRSQRCPHCGERIEWRYDLDIRFRSKSRGRARESGARNEPKASRMSEGQELPPAAAKALPPKKGGRGEGKEGASAGKLKDHTSADPNWDDVDAAEVQADADVKREKEHEP